MDVPFETVVKHIHTHDPYGPFGAKGAGEASSCSTLAAIANGIYDAVGVRIKDLPITPEKILQALKGTASSLKGTGKSSLRQKEGK
jgi:CO/xanthine dehydrogenase Mo-binding subunit